MKQIIEWRKMAQQEPPEEAYLLLLVREKGLDFIPAASFHYSLINDDGDYAFEQVGERIDGDFYPRGDVIAWALLPQPPDDTTTYTLARCEMLLREAADNAEMCLSGTEQDEQEKRRARRYRRAANQLKKLGG